MTAQVKVAVSNDGSRLITSRPVGVVIAATGVPAVGAGIGIRAMELGKMIPEHELRHEMKGWFR